jgi:hypothetical protein
MAVEYLLFPFYDEQKDSCHFDFTSKKWQLDGKV